VPGAARDRILPVRRYSQRLRDMLPNAEWTELPDVGHVPMSDDPALVARTITEFVMRVGEPAPAAA
jgi:pimeloyl-ACP methyl ester carboxylesterase